MGCSQLTTLTTLVLGKNFPINKLETNAILKKTLNFWMQMPSPVSSTSSMLDLDIWPLAELTLSEQHKHSFYFPFICMAARDRSTGDNIKGLPANRPVLAETSISSKYINTDLSKSQMWTLQHEFVCIAIYKTVQMTTSEERRWSLQRGIFVLIFFHSVLQNCDILHLVSSVKSS